MTCARRPRAFLWLLLAAALFMRAFLPQGYMPERSADGAITVKVCGSGHVVRIPLGKKDAPGEKQAQPPCAFAGLGTPALPPPEVAIALLGSAQPAFATAEPAAARIANPRLHPPARGPPSTA